jgi:hypothetical protein
MLINMLYTTLRNFKYIKSGHISFVQHTEFKTWHLRIVMFCHFIRLESSKMIQSNPKLWQHVFLI